MELQPLESRAGQGCCENNAEQAVPAKVRVTLSIALHSNKEIYVLE